MVDLPPLELLVLIYSTITQLVLCCSISVVWTTKQDYDYSGPSDQKQQNQDQLLPSDALNHHALKIQPTSWL